MGVVAMADIDMEELFQEIQDINDSIYWYEDWLIVNIAYPYEIYKDRIDTDDKILGWIYHLSDKTWMSKDHIKRFIYVATKERVKGV